MVSPPVPPPTVSATLSEISIKAPPPPFVARVSARYVPERYDDLWTGAKGFYKVEPVVADGGQVVLYAPHISRISAMRAAMLDPIEALRYE